MPYRLGVDLGTTFTAAAVSDGSTEPTVIGLGNRALQIPSVLFLKPDGEFLVGEAAERRGLTEPDRLAREFKRRIGDHVPIMVAGAPFSAQALTAHLLRWVVGRATERMGEPPAEVILTHPANWGPFRIELLDQVAAMAGLAAAGRCTEPEAAAAQYAAHTRVAPGDRVAVYDLGGGTFDACVLEKTDTGFRVLGTPEGVEHLGGVDFDEAVLRHVLGALGAGAAALDPEDPAVTVGLARLRRDCVEAKEALSADVDTLVPVALPGLSTTVRITRAEFELMIRPALAETIAAMNRALQSAHVEPSTLRSILLVGGSSRIPLVSEVLTREFSVPTALDTHPKHDVALGSVRAGQDETDVVTAPRPPSPSVSPEPDEGRSSTGSDRIPTEAASAAAAATEVPVAYEAPAPRQPTAAVFDTPATTPLPSPPPTPARAVRPSASAPGGVARGPGSAGSPTPVEPTAAAAGASGGPAGAFSEAESTPPPSPGLAGLTGPSDHGAATPSPATEPTNDEPTRPTGGLLRVLVVVLAAVVLGVGVGVAIALRNRDEPTADPPITSTPPIGVSTPVDTPTPTPTEAAVPQSTEPLGDEVLVWPRVRDGNYDIALLDLESGKETPLTTSRLEDTLPIMSPDRRSIIYIQVEDKVRSLRIMGADGRGDRALFSELPEGCKQMSRPAWGPDGQLAVSCRTSSDSEDAPLLLVTLDGDVVRQLDGRGRSDDPTFTPDGQSVIYWQSSDADGDGGALHLVATDGSADPVRLTEGGPDAEDADPVCSPDGTQIAFRRLADRTRTVLVAPFDGKTLTGNAAVVSGGENDQDPSWSPDGGRIAYKQGPNTKADLRVVDLESGATKVVVDNPEPDTAPAWTAR